MKACGLFCYPPCLRIVASIRASYFAVATRAVAMASSVARCGQRASSLASRIRVSDHSSCAKHMLDSGCALAAAVLVMSSSPALAHDADLPRTSTSSQQQQQTFTQSAWQPVQAPNLVGATAAEACPERSGIAQYVCYGPCCGLDWGPGGPICLALAGISLRSGVPWTFSGWVRKNVGAPLDTTPDSGTLLLALALFVSSVPRTFAAVACGWAFMVLCLV